jgi:hypothetical protein
MDNNYIASEMIRVAKVLTGGIFLDVRFARKKNIVKISGRIGLGAFNNSLEISYLENLAKKCSAYVGSAQMVARIHNGRAVPFGETEIRVNEPDLIHYSSVIFKTEEDAEKFAVQFGEGKNERVNSLLDLY